MRKESGLLRLFNETLSAGTEIELRELRKAVRWATSMLSPAIEPDL